MFNQEEFAKNQFIKEKINYECLAGKATDKIIHIAFNINDAFFMQMGVTVTSILKIILIKPLLFTFFVTV